MMEIEVYFRAQLQETLLPQAIDLIYPGKFHAQSKLWNCFDICGAILLCVWLLVFFFSFCILLWATNFILCFPISPMFSTVFIVVFSSFLFDSFIQIHVENSLFPTDHWRVLVRTYASFDFWVGNMNYIYRIQLLRTKHNNRKEERERKSEREYWDENEIKKNMFLWLPEN